MGHNLAETTITADWCNDYSEIKTFYYYINSQDDDVPMSGYYNDVDGNKITNCSTANRCTKGGQEYTFFEVYNGTWTNTSCTWDGNECGSGEECLYDGSFPTQRCDSYYGPCKCASNVSTDHCHYGCSYDFEVTYSNNTYEYYSDMPNNYNDLPQKFHGSTIEFTCEANSCGFGSDVDASTSVVVGKPDKSDSTDGCSQGTNTNIVTAPAKDYNSPTYSWTCDGSGGGADKDISNSEPYKCVAGEFCDGNIVVTVNAACKESTANCSTPNDEYCKEASNTAQCVQCTQDSHCPAGTCSNNTCVNSCTSHRESQCSGAYYCTACGTGFNWATCSGTGTCQSCVWGNWYCRADGKRARDCRAGGPLRKNKQITCPTGQTCSGGQCS